MKKFLTIIITYRKLLNRLKYKNYSHMKNIEKKKKNSRCLSTKRDIYNDHYL